jgi:hypothetical protein
VMRRRSSERPPGRQISISTGSAGVSRASVAAARREPPRRLTPGRPRTPPALSAAAITAVRLGKGGFDWRWFRRGFERLVPLLLLRPGPVRRLAGAGASSGADTASGDRRLRRGIAGDV